MPSIHDNRWAWINGLKGDRLVACLPVSPSPFHSPVLRLMQGIFDHFHDQKFFYLRRRVFVSYPLSDWEYRLIRVCAKRYQVASPPHDGSEDVLWEDPFQDVDHDRPRWESGALFDVMQFHEQVRAKTVPLYAQPRPVKAVLCSSKGEILMDAVNTNHRYRFAHAEFNLFYKCHQHNIEIPPGSILYVNLKPCMMCAALIEAYAPKDLHVVAFQDDPGPMARHSYLSSRLKIMSNHTVS